MRYKQNIVEKLNQLDATINKLQFQINRNFNQEQLTDTSISLKEQVEKLQEIISLEYDEFENQFANR